MPASILAEPRRRKQRLGIDPQNLQWRHSKTNNFGKKILEQMGWQDGKGVGKNEQGMPENVKLNPNYVGKGLGTDANRKPEAWIAHNEDFASILESLNKYKTSAPAFANDKKIHTLITIAPNTTHRVKRSVSVKHLSQCNDHEKSGIFGISKKNKEEQSEVSDLILKKIKKEVSDEVIEEKTVVSTLLMNDYFKNKMKQKDLNQSKKACEELETKVIDECKTKTKVEEDDEKTKIKEKIKRKKARKTEEV